jgi:hypothetical protein
LRGKETASIPILESSPGDCKRNDGPGNPRRCIGRRDRSSWASKQTPPGSRADSKNSDLCESSPELGIRDTESNSASAINVWETDQPSLGEGQKWK